MHNVELFIALLAGVLALVWLAGPLRLPQPVLLVLGGLGAGLLPFLPDITVQPDFVLLAFLPPILYRASFAFADEDVRWSWQAIALLAVGLVLVTIGAVAAVAHALIGIPWAPAFALGAILGPTDPVAATSVIRRLGAPDRIATILEGESLVNDGSGLTAFRIAVAVIGGEAFRFGPAVLQFAGVAVGGLALGAALGWLTTVVRRRLAAAELEITAALVLAYGAFAAAERLQLSGILAVVAAGFVVGRAENFSDPETRLQARGFWTTLAFVAESTLFLLVGVAFADALGREDAAIGPLLRDSLVIAATCIAVRLAWMCTVPHVAARLDRRMEGSQPLSNPRERVLLGVCGMRGAVSIAAALAIPAGAEARAQVLLLACGAVLFTLVPIAVGLPVLVRRLGLAQDVQARRRYVEARVQVAHSALQAADELDGEDAPERLLARAREAYELKIARLESSLEDGGHEHGEDADAYRRLRHRLVSAEQEALQELSARHEIRGPALRRIQQELDLEETRLDG